MATRIRPAEGDAACQTCGGELQPKIAYCPHCGQRTRYASKMVRFWARIEVLFILLMFVLVMSFALIYYFQR